MARLFVAAWADDDLRHRLARLPRPDEAGVRWVAPDDWHVTLHFLGESCLDDVVSRLSDASLPTARVRLGPSIERLGPRVIIVPAAGADELAIAVRAATDGIGRRSRHPYRGHLTLARTRPNAPSATIGHPVEAMLAVDEVALVSSELSASGSTYRIVATFATG